MEKLENFVNDLIEDVPEYYSKLQLSNYKKTVDLLISFFPCVEFATEYDIDNILNSNRFEEVYNKCTNKLRLYTILNIYVDEYVKVKLKGFLKENYIYDAIDAIITCSGCKNIEINKNLVDYYLNVVNQMGCVHSIDEEEMISTIFNPVKVRVKKLRNING